MRKLFFILCCVLLGSCSGRPPAPVNNYGRNGGPTSYNTSGNRPPLPGQKGTTSSVNAKAEVGSGLSGKLSGQEVFRKCNTAVFMVYTSTGTQRFQGSGFFISPNGLAISNYHIFKGTGIGLEVIKLSNNQQYKLDEVIYKDKENDVMIFTVKNTSGTKFNYIPISSHNAQVGDKAYAIGSPRGLENTFSSGEISQFREGGNLIQISVPIDHGSSGGALINEYGEAIGITCGGYDDSGANLNFAVNINIIRNRFK